MATVFYRKYRPQTFAELVGQSQINQFLIKNLQEGKLAHAYLFAGPRGTGKTSTARLLAKAVNCQPNIVFPDKKDYPLNELKFLKSGDVCGDKCANCQAIASGSFLDLIEIDAASNRGIDEIRDLREKARLTTTQGYFKVYIIDEVHMLTNEAFNALLKTLEEPPAHVVFVLATTEIHKIPATIASRAQKFEFKRAEKADVLSYLQRITDQEKLEVEKGALEELAKGADGSYRDGAKILEQLSGQGVTLERVSQVLGSSSGNLALEVVELALSKKEAEIVEKLDSAAKAGLNAKSFSYVVLEVIQALVMVKLNLIDLAGQRLAPEEVEKAKGVVKGVKTSDLSALADLVLKSLDQINVSPLPLLPLQMALIKFIGGEEKPAVLVVENIEPDDEPVLEEPKEVKVPEEVKLNVVAVDQPEKTNAPAPTGNIMDGWLSMLKIIKPQNISLEALLRSTGPLGIENDELTIQFFYSFHRDKVNETRNFRLLNEAIKEAFGRSLKVKFVMGQRAVKKSNDEIIEELKNIKPITDDNLLTAANDIFSTDIN